MNVVTLYRHEANNNLDKFLSTRSMEELKQLQEQMAHEIKNYHMYHSNESVERFRRFGRPYLKRLDKVCSALARAVVGKVRDEHHRRD